MAYTPRFKSQTILKASDLNDMDQMIYNNSQNINTLLTEGAGKANYSVNDINSKNYIDGRPFYLRQDTFPIYAWDGSEKAVNVVVNNFTFHQLSSDVIDEEYCVDGTFDAVLYGENVTQIPIVALVRTYSDLMVLLMTAEQWAYNTPVVGVFLPTYLLGIDEYNGLILCAFMTSDINTTPADEVSDMGDAVGGMADSVLEMAIPMGVFVRSDSVASGFYGVVTNNEDNSRNYIQQVHFNNVIIDPAYENFFNSLHTRVRSLSITGSDTEDLIAGAMEFLNFKDGDLIIITGDVLDGLGG